MTIDNWLQAATEELKASGIVTARLDALVLLEDRLGHDRAYLLAYSEQQLGVEAMQTLAAHINRRKTHEPLAYIRGRVEFYGRDFAVNKHVLVPRPESESFFALVEQITPDGGHTLVDVGTGSGALAVTAKLQWPETEVIAIDIDPQCLSTARHNAAAHKAEVTFLEGDLLQPLFSYRYTDMTLLCNLPYVPESYEVNQAAGYEPRLALFAGPEGLDLYRRLFGQLEHLPAKPRHILTESLLGQHDDIRKLAREYGYQETATDGLVQVFNCH